MLSSVMIFFFYGKCVLHNQYLCYLIEQTCDKLKNPRATRTAWLLLASFTSPCPGGLRISVYFCFRSGDCKSISSFSYSNYSVTTCTHRCRPKSTSNWIVFFSCLNINFTIKQQTWWSHLVHHKCCHTPFYSHQKSHISITFLTHCFAHITKEIFYPCITV